MSSELLKDEQLKGVSADDFLELRFDEVEAAKDFMLYPKGIYIFEIEEWEKRTDIGKDKLEAWQVSLKPVAIEELESEEDEETAQKVLENEQPFREMYMQGFGYQNLTGRWMEIATGLGVEGFGEFFEKSPGTMIRARVTHRASKNDKSIINANLRDVVAVQAGE